MYNSSVSKKQTTDTKGTIVTEFSFDTNVTVSVKSVSVDGDVTFTGVHPWTGKTVTVKVDTTMVRWTKHFSGFVFPSVWSTDDAEDMMKDTADGAVSVTVD